MPSGLPMPVLPEITAERVVAVLPDAIAFTLLGAIESLLSAVVADSMTGRRHRSNCELVAQGAANVGSALFGGFCVTGTIARTATNVRAGARGPVSGMVHAGALLLFVIFLAPLADAIPLAALAGVLIVVAWTMFERHAFAALLSGNRGDALVLLATFGLTVFRDLTEAIVVGFALGSVLFIHRMSQVTAVESHVPFVSEDRPDAEPVPGNELVPVSRDIVVHRVRGVLFFGAASIMESVLDRIADTHRALVIDLAGTPFLDSSGAQAVAAIVSRAGKRGVRVYLTGTDPAARRELAAQGLRPPATIFRETVEAALEDWRRVSRSR
jgi:SulP family sulfate permease